MLGYTVQIYCDFSGYTDIARGVSFLFGIRLAVGQSLGPVGSLAAGFAIANVASPAMIDGNYVLQATLYQVALHRYLQWRLRGYDPQHHLGGAMYLFVRGMAGPDGPVVDGERCGVARWRPPVEVGSSSRSAAPGPGPARQSLVGVATGETHTIVRE